MLIGFYYNIFSIDKKKEDFGLKTIIVVQIFKLFFEGLRKDWEDSV